MILVTGAGGGLGRLIAQRLAGRQDVVLGTRQPGPAERRIDFDDPASLADGFAGAGTLLLISAGYGEDDIVIARHEAAISAAEQAGVRHVVYTSLSAAGDHLAYALPHRWTERRLRESALDWTILRNGLYAELLALLAPPGPDGRITAPLGSGRLAAVAREDLADAAARVAVSAAEHAERVYELVGERALGGSDLAAALAVPYEPGSLAEARESIAASGAQPFQVPMLVGTYSAISAGFMDATGGDLATLLGRRPRPALEVYAQVLAGA
ncbi:NAD(P)H-binding protein [Streptomyces sp. A3M-1-3]|uniref:NAD(P)H-binding protein n=1 Tax=Streptomyces sp. A3M-1-3 TaxID=2962044 RepID=UPI0020B78CB8|nr:NAD(P)H-binding protein [Streptomyces sp. A3M-1-3]MCP3821655.1 NAD(P)H-binding protein [Streptomyces sp. A3M-1-3]